MKNILNKINLIKKKKVNQKKKFIEKSLFRIGAQKKMSREKCLKILIRLLILLAISSSILITISIMITLIDILLFVDFNNDHYHLNMNPLFYWSIFMINFFILISIIFTWKNLFQISNEYYIQCYLMPMEKLKFFQCFHSLMFIIMAIFIFYLIIRQLFIAYDEGKF